MRGIYLGLCITALTGAAIAQDFPSRPVKIVVPYPPSGNVDITARTIGPALGDALGQPIVIENRAGAGGTIGTSAVIKSPPDGYSLVLGSSATITAGPAVYKQPPYDPFKDLVAIGAIQLAPIVLTVAPNTPVKSFAEYVARAAPLRKAMSNQTVRARFHAMGVEVMDMSRAEFAVYVRADYDKWLKLAREANIVIE